MHAGGYDTYAEAREARLERLDDEHRRYAERHRQLVAHHKEMKRKAAYNAKFASLARSAEKKVARHEERDRPQEKAEVQNVRMQIAGGRTGKRALRFHELALSGLTEPFSSEVLYGERVGLLGATGTGKTHLLRLLAGEEIEYPGDYRLGARVEPGLARSMLRIVRLALSVTV